MSRKLVQSVLIRGIANKLPDSVNFLNLERGFGGLSFTQTKKIRDILTRRGIFRKQTAGADPVSTVPADIISSVRWQLEFPTTTIITSPYSTGPTTTTPKKKKEVHYEDLLELINNGDLQLIDVREPREVENGQIPTSINIPLPQLKYSLQLPDQLYNKQYGTSRRAQPFGDDLVFYGLCSTKGLTALEIAFRLGLRKARHYPGGFQEWCEKQSIKV